MPITIKDVAKLVGVTPATVSMVINNKPRISEDTRKKVLAAIDELQYVPHEGARNLVLKRTNTIGVLVPAFSSHFILETLSGIEKEVGQTKFSLVLFGTRGLQKTQGEIVDKIISERKVDGLIGINLNLQPVKIEKLRKNKIAIVCLESDTKDCDCVLVDHLTGSRTAVQHLIDRGHRRIALINGDSNGVAARQRRQGYIEALANASVKPDSRLEMEVLNYSRADGKNACLQILSRAEPPTAIFVAAGDICATGVYQALKEKGYRVPEDISVVGFDDQPISEFMDPALTTVYQPMENMGIQAVKLLLAKIGTPDEKKCQKVRFDTSLVIRQSTSSLT